MAMANRSAICFPGYFVYLRDCVTKSMYLTHVSARAGGQVPSPTLKTSSGNAAQGGVSTEMRQKEVIMPTGKVKWFNQVKGYGFIQPEDGSRDAFVHISAVERAGLSTLNEGQKVSYELVPGRNGKMSAENLTLAD